MASSLIRVTATLTLLCLFTGALATAAPATENEQLVQVPLTKDTVIRMLAAFPKLKALGKKYEADAPLASSGEDGPVARLSGYLEHRAARAEIEAVLAGHGFSGFPEWLNVARSVAIAYSFVKSGKTPEQLGGQAARAIEAVRNNPKLTPAQKKQMETLVARQLDKLKRLEPPAENIALAREMRSKIAAVMDSD